MTAESIAAALKVQLGAAASAPVPFAVAVALAGAVIWYVLNWSYGSIIRSLRERLLDRDDQIARLKAASSALPAPTEQTPKKPELSSKARATGEAAMQRLRVIRAMDNAIDAIPMAEGRPKTADWERVRPIIRAALLSVNKEFKVPIPTATQADASLESEVGRRYWRDVRPYLSEGHDDAAYAAAITCLKKFGLLPDDVVPSRTAIL